jgi:hypothetical protein
MTRDEAADLKTSMHNVFDTPSGVVVMRFLEKIGKWYPTVYDSGETNEIIARDANRRLIGTVKTILVLNPEQIVEITKEK